MTSPLSDEHGTRRWPRPLRSGDQVAVVASSGPYDADRVSRGAAVLQSWGLVVRQLPPARPTDSLPYLAGPDKARADQLSDAWSDPEVAAVWAARGGYGSQRMVDLVDYAALRLAGRKHLVGFSDITGLLTRIGRELDQVTLHGPVLGSVSQLGDGPSVEQLRRLLMSAPVAGAPLASGATVVPGDAVGRLVGGNLSLVAADVGVEPPPSVPSIAVFEDTGEEAYRVDRMLTQLIRSGWFASVVGVVVGDFTECGDPELVQRVIVDRLGQLGVPVLSGLPVGHADRNLALPLGAPVRLAATESHGALRLAPEAEAV